MMQDDQDHAVQMAHVSRRFGHQYALKDVSLTVPRGVVLGLVGQNGAGKTTLLRHVLGLLRPQTGRVSVFGRDPVASPEVVLADIGYVSEQRDLPGWMRVDELLRYSKAFYPRWDDSWATDLCQRFQVDVHQRVKDLSRGQHVRVALVLALAHRPALLVLDEPSSGLDPLVRRDILEAIVRIVAEEGRSVLFSSHLLDEVERMADHVAVIDRGRIVVAGEMETVRTAHSQWTVRPADPTKEPATIPGLLTCQRTGREMSLVCQGDPDAIRRSMVEAGFEVLAHQPASLDEIFMAHASEARA